MALATAPALPLIMPAGDLTYAEDDELVRITIADALGNTNAGKIGNGHGTALVAALLIAQHDWDAAHQLLLGKGSAVHAPLSNGWKPGDSTSSIASATLAYLHAIVHRIEAEEANEGDTPGYRNAEYWHRNAGTHPAEASLGIICRQERWHHVEAACIRIDGLSTFANAKIVQLNAALD